MAIAIASILGLESSYVVYHYSAVQADAEELLA